MVMGGRASTHTRTRSSSRSVCQPTTMQSTEGQIMKKVCVLAPMALLAGAVATITGADNQKTLVVTSSNTPSNELLVYDTGGVLVQIAPTLGQGGVGGNAGGIAKQNGTVAVVNFGSQSVSLFSRDGTGFAVRQAVTPV